MKTLLIFLSLIQCLNAAVSEDILAKLEVDTYLNRINKFKKDKNKKISPYDIKHMYKYMAYWLMFDTDNYKSSLISNLRASFSEDELLTISKNLDKLFIRKFIQKISFDRDLFAFFIEMHFTDTFVKLDKKNRLYFDIFKYLNLDNQTQKCQDLLEQSLTSSKLMFLYYENSNKRARLNGINLRLINKYIDDYYKSIMSRDIKYLSKSSYLELIRSSQKSPKLVEFIRLIFNYHFNYTYKIFAEYSNVKRQTLK